ncbi:flippase [Mastigocoleus sp. MO_188.B34]|uniref:flippase n=1 Tax=Mastigocoleus sp. MO_188.B34 TaxID=3036635 RepID=UPI00260AAF6D|nr:flippase [Mastigocoleus sp. MO_188.B34]MDJ0696538.1 flippase [Mastigocoleus sp. MO_188.B34]
MLSKIQKLLPFGRKFSSSSRAIIANTGWLFADRILRMGVGLFVGVWLARYLGVQLYGIFNYATAFVILFSPLATLGLERVVVQHLVRHSSIKDEILGTAFWLKLLGGVASLLLAVSSIYFLRQDEKLVVWLVAILSTVVIFQAFDTIDLWFQSKVESKYTVLAKNTAFIFSTLIKVILITIQAPLIAFAWVVLAEMGLSAVGLAITYCIKGYSIKLWRWSFPIAKTLLKNSWPLVFSDLAAIIYTKIDQIMLGEMVDSSAVGIYSVAVRISEAWYFIPRTITSSASPSIYAAKETDETLYYKRIKKLLRLLLILSIFIAVPITLFSDNIITILFGYEYIAAAPVLSVHAWASLFVFLRVGTVSWFNAEGLNQFVLRRNLTGAIINIVLNLFLIPIYAELGAAIATLISYASAEFLSDMFYAKTRKIFKIQLQTFLFFK